MAVFSFNYTLYDDFIIKIAIQIWKQSVLLISYHDNDLKSTFIGLPTTFVDMSA